MGSQDQTFDAWIDAILANLSQIDGNWIDICSLIVALVYAIYQWHKQCATGRRTRLISKSTAASVANGTSLFPMFLLGLAVFSSSLMQQLLTANRVILSVSGIVALFAILEDAASSDAPDETSKAG